MLPSNTLLQNRYLIIRQLGRGGMGAVYEAIDQRVSCVVALKETLVETDELRHAFGHEARLLANLSHPALPKVTDYFFEADRQFLVMEFISGMDLAQLLNLRGGAFPITDVLTWADTLLDALEYLHTSPSTVLHRDIKPSNIKLTEKNKIYLLDFGLSKGVAGQMTALNADKSIVGHTPHYAPLEQVMRSGTDPRSDLYSLGATLYHLMTGVIPPDAPRRKEAIDEGQPDPLATNERINLLPAPVASALLRAMAIDRRERPASADEMREQLRDARSFTLNTLGGTSTLPMPDAPAPSAFVTNAMTTEERTAIRRVPPSSPTRPQTISTQAQQDIPASAPASVVTVVRRKQWPRIAAGLLALLIIGFIAGIAALFYLQNRFGIASPARDSQPSLTSAPPRTQAGAMPDSIASPETEIQTGTVEEPNVSAPQTAATQLPPVVISTPTATTISTPSTEASNAADSSPSSNVNRTPIKKVESQNFTFGLIECRLSSSKVVTCDLVVTNEDEDRNLELFGGGSQRGYTTLGNTSEDSNMFDNFGNAYVGRAAQIANSSIGFGDSATTVLISKVPTRASIKFENVSPQATKIARLNLKWRVGRESFETPLRDIPIKRQQ